MELKNIISKSSFSDKEKMIGQVIRLALLDGRFPMTQRGAYSGQDSIGIYQIQIDAKTGDKRMKGGFSIPTDLDKLDDRYVLWAYEQIAGGMKLSVADYAEAGGDLVEFGDIVADRLLEAKLKKGNKEGSYRFITASSALRQNSFLSNPVAQTAGIKRELADLVDDQVNEDLGKAQDEVDRRVAAKGN